MSIGDQNLVRPKSFIQKCFLSKNKYGKKPYQGHDLFIKITKKGGKIGGEIDGDTLTHN